MGMHSLWPVLLVDKLIMYKWEGSGWCVGKILIIKFVSEKSKIKRH